MTSLPAILALGFFLGMRHATDPDHVIAVTTIVTRQKSLRGAALIGGVWGVGHTLTIMLVGGGILLFGWVIPSRVGLSMEFAVGVMLIVLGLANLGDIVRLVNRSTAGKADDTGHAHSHAHSHGDFVHTHHHVHDPEVHPHDPDRTPVIWLDRHLGGMGLYRLLRPLVIGVVHGLAGSAAVALLVLAAIGNPAWGVFYLAVFGVGTIVGMMLITGAIASPMLYGRNVSERFAGGLRIASGLVSVAFGFWVAYQVVIVDGLFTGNPNWTPR